MAQAALLGAKVNDAPHQSILRLADRLLGSSVGMADAGDDSCCGEKKGGNKAGGACCG